MTGANSGIGFCLSQYFAKRGATVLPSTCAECSHSPTTPPLPSHRLEEATAISHGGSSQLNSKAAPDKPLSCVLSSSVLSAPSLVSSFFSIPGSQLRSPSFSHFPPPIPRLSYSIPARFFLPPSSVPTSLGPSVQPSVPLFHSILPLRSPSFTAAVHGMPLQGACGGRSRQDHERERLAIGAHPHRGLWS